MKYPTFLRSYPYSNLRCILKPAMLAAFLLPAAFVQADSLMLQVVTPVPLEKNHSFVLLDEASQCRYIGKVQQLSDQAAAAQWVMKVEEKWCRPNAYRPERATDFKGAILELSNPLKPGDKVSLSLTPAS